MSLPKAWSFTFELTAPTMSLVIKRTDVTSIGFDFLSDAAVRYACTATSASSSPASTPRADYTTPGQPQRVVLGLEEELRPDTEYFVQCSGTTEGTDTPVEGMTEVVGPVRTQQDVDSSVAAISARVACDCPQTGKPVAREYPLDAGACDQNYSFSIQGFAMDCEVDVYVTESARACSYILSKQVQKTC